MKVDTKQKGTSEITDENIEGAPMLFVDVNFGAGKAQRIVVHEGDRSDLLAAKFAKAHSIK